MVSPAVVPRGRAAAAPGAVVHAIAGVGIATLLWSASTPRWSLGAAVIAAVTLLGVTAAWLVRWSSWFVARRAGTARGGAGRAAVLPIAAVVVLALLLTAAPLRLRFWLSRDDFRAALTEAPTHEPRRLGLYRVQSAFSGIFHLTAAGPGSRHGFVFSPHRHPSALVDDATAGHPVRFRDLGDGWYAWVSGHF